MLAFTSSMASGSSMQARTAARTSFCVISLSSTPCRTASAMRVCALSAKYWSTVVWTARIRRAVSGLPLPKSSSFIASLTESGSLLSSVTPNIPMMADLNWLRTSSFAALELELRKMLPMKSDFDFAPTTSVPRLSTNRSSFLFFFAP